MVLGQAGVQPVEAMQQSGRTAAEALGPEREQPAWEQEHSFQFLEEGGVLGEGTVLEGGEEGRVVLEEARGERKEGFEK